MPAASSRRCIHHGDGRVGSTPSTRRATNRAHAGSSSRTGQASPSAAGTATRAAGSAKSASAEAGELAGQAAHREAVAAVGRHVQLDHRLVQAEHLGGGVARLGGARAAARGCRRGRSRCPARAPRRSCRRRRGRRSCGPRSRTRRAARRRAGRPRRGRRRRSCVAPQMMPLRLGVADVDLAPADRLLELGQLLDLEDPSDHQRAGDVRRRVDLLDLQADPDEGLAELVGRLRRRSSTCSAQPGLR